MSTTITITIPAAQRAAGRVLLIKEEDGYAGSSSPVNVTAGSGGGNIEGSTTYAITTSKGFVKLICDGTNWHVIGKP